MRANVPKTDTAVELSSGMHSASTPSWDFDEDKSQTLPDDSLLACLMIMSKYYQNPFSAASLCADLPLENNRLSPSLFARAAERAGLKSQLRTRTLKNIVSATLPAVLLLKDQKAVVLVALTADQATVIDPECGTGTKNIAVTDLEENYLRHVIFIRPIYDFSSRSKEVFDIHHGHWFWSVFKKSIPIYSEVIIASFLISLFALAVPLFIMNVYDRVVPNDAFETLWVLALGVGIVFIFDFILRSFRGYFIDNVSKSTDIRLSALLFTQVTGIKMANRPESVGVFSNAISSFEFFRDFIASSTVTILVDIPFFFLFVGIIFLLGGNLGFIPLTLMFIILIMQLLLHIPVTRLTAKLNGYSAEKQATLYETLSNAETIKTESAEGKCQGRWERVIGLSANINAKLRFWNNFGTNFSLVIQQSTTVILIIAGVYKVSNGNLSVGALIAVVIISSRALAPVTQLSALISRYHQAKQSLKAVDKIMQLPVDRPLGAKPLHRPRVDGDIQFDKVSFSYPGQRTSVLTDISLHIKKGERVAVIGRIGSGKTTLAKLILGLYETSKGILSIDGTAVNQYDVADLRRNIGYVPQDIHLFHGSIKDNIIFGHPYVDDDAVLRAADIAGVSQFTDKDEKGFDRQVGENGQRLSGGQRQTIAIARALMNEPSILMFDEPCSTMDSSSEKSFKEALSKHLQQRTFIIMTHKSSMLQLVDRLIVLEKGRIVADGAKNKVMAALRAGQIQSL